MRITTEFLVRLQNRNLKTEYNAENLTRNLN
jgi:hypothetical protein